MILTEKEARGKICCGPTVLHRDFNFDPKCIASGCMAWRWLPKNENTPMNNDAEWVLSGYCGLAGEPEDY